MSTPIVFRTNYPFSFFLSLRYLSRFFKAKITLKKNNKQEVTPQKIFNNEKYLTMGDKQANAWEGLTRLIKKYWSRGLILRDLTANTDTKVSAAE